MLALDDLEQIKGEISRKLALVQSNGDKQEFDAWFTGLMFALKMALPASPLLQDLHKYAEVPSVYQDEDKRVRNGLKRLINDS